MRPCSRTIIFSQIIYLTKNRLTCTLGIIPGRCFQPLDIESCYQGHVAQMVSTSFEAAEDGFVVENDHVGIA